MTPANFLNGLYLFILVHFMLFAERPAYEDPWNGNDAKFVSRAQIDGCCVNAKNHLGKQKEIPVVGL